VRFECRDRKNPLDLRHGGSVIDGPSIVNGFLFWGSGYRRIRPGIGNNKLYAFTLAKSQDDFDDQ
jgi:hypothetical protein